MNCIQVRRKLNAYIDNEIIDGSEQDIAHHLAVCPGCRGLRQALVTPGFYVRKLNEMPQQSSLRGAPKLRGDEAISEEIASLPSAVRNDARNYRIAVSAALIAAVFGFFALAGHFKKPSGESAFSEGRGLSFNTSTPAMVCLAERTWLSLQGKGKLYRGRGYVNVDLAEGSIYYASDAPLFGPYVIIHAAGFQITNTKTEFYAGAENDRVKIELLSGSLVVKYGTRRHLQAVRITAGTGAACAQEGGSQRLSTYKLSDSEKAALSRKIDQVRKIGRFAENNPKQDKFVSGTTRIEFWRGD